ncbi:YbhN family protein [Gordonia sp. PKS22-38]|uniref:YbhN family protein n=1 Tax=Gordonia prachuapensis TaxID=3115651 RepID=A0ABU7MPG7_9ACTN|nr:YbhN family protein [Gordonia sp. PKS22-38]
MSSERPAIGSVTTRPRFWWLRWVLLAIVVAILAVEIVLISPSLEEAWQRIGDLEWGWIAASVVAALLSMDSYAQVQRALLRSAGVRVGQWQSLSVILASNAVSQTMPGGPVLSPAFVYRETRKWGATPVVASWQVVMSGLLAGVGLAVLGFGGALLAGAKTSPFSVVFSVLGFIAVAVVFQYLASHPESLQSTLLRVMDWINQVRSKEHGHGHDRIMETLEQLRAVQLSKRDLGVSFGWSLFNWVADVACLAFACWAVGAHPSIAGLMVAYAAGKAVGTAVPLLPGGIGVVDAVLVPALTSAGMPAADAITAVLVYRVISYILIAAIGWVVVLFMFRSSFRTDETLEEELDRDLSTGDRGAGDRADVTPESDPGRDRDADRDDGPRPDDQLP